MKTKKGRLSSTEQTYILKHMNNSSPAQISVKLRRTEKTVKQFIEKNREFFTKSQAKEGSNAEIKKELQTTEWWARIKEEFSGRELKLFEERYLELMYQFTDKNKVLTTERIQIVQAIKFEILMSRNLVGRQEAVKEIIHLQKIQNDFMRKFGSDTSSMTDLERDYHLNLETQIQAAKSTENAKTNEYVKLQNQHDDLMKALKGTRDQRIKEIESGEKNFLGLIKMLQDREVQEKEGREMELTRIATERKLNQLGQLHKYIDGQYDRPILSADTVNLEDT